MISRYYGTLNQPSAELTEVYDFDALESLDEFRRVAGLARVITIFSTTCDGHAVVYGRDILEAVVSEGETHRAVHVAFALDFASDQLEQCLALVEAVKGYHEYVAHGGTSS